MTCQFASARRLLVVLVASLMLCAGIAQAQLRTLPVNAKRATVGQHAPLPFVYLSGNRMKLAPGGVIYDLNNRSILHEALPPGEDVAYTLDISGDVARIYILTPQEQAQFDKKKK
ncbi:MAG: hypothetical protein ABIS45_14525 [Burkholderiales bacterium]